MLNLNNIKVATKLFHTSNIDEWMEASFEDHAERRRRSGGKSMPCNNASKLDAASASTKTGATTPQHK